MANPQANRIKGFGSNLRGGAILTTGNTRLLVNGGTTLFVGNYINGTAFSASMEYTGGAWARQPSAYE